MNRLFHLFRRQLREWDLVPLTHVVPSLTRFLKCCDGSKCNNSFPLQQGVGST